jgi:hypothetical protein
VKDARWLDRGSLELVGAVFLLNVVGFGLVAPYRPNLGATLFFVAVVVVLALLAVRAPADPLRARPGPPRLGRLGLVLAGTLLWAAWLVLLLFSGLGRPPAVVAAGFFVLVNLGTLALLLRTVGSEHLERSEYYFASGMLIALVPWDVIVEFSVPGILVVTAIILYLQYRLGRRIAARSTPVPIPAGAQAPPSA